ncbi:MAG: AsmA-like C-terminal region-containing protein [Alphaproteobacteria bacterium]|nr:AsmA-like C-terminal region-containing protein [Alphaproteobacteria bacterium]
MQIGNLDTTLDATRMTGNVSMQWRDRPAFGVNTRIDKINVDAYMPIRKSSARQTQLAQAQQGATDGQPPAAQKPAGQTPPANPMETLRLLERFDLNLQTEIGSMTYRDTPIQDLKMNLELVDGKLTIKEATVRDVAGAQAAFTLMAERLSTSPAFSTAFNLRATDAKRFLKFATGYDSPLPPQALGSLTAKGSVAGTADQLKIDTQMEGFGGSGKVVGSLAQLTQPVPKVDLTIDASFPEFGPVLGAFVGDKAKHGTSKLGPFALKSQIANSGADAVVLRRTELRAFGGDLDIDGTIGQLGSPSPSVDLGLKMNMPSLRPLLTAFNPDPQLMASADRLGGLAFNGRAAGNAKKVTLKDAALNGLGGSVKLNGDILEQGKQYDLTADIQNFNVGPLLAALPGQVVTAQGAQQLGPLTGRIGLKGALDNLSVAIQNANMRAFNGTMAVNGTVSDALDPTRKADLAFDIAGVHAGQLLAAFPASGASPALAQGLQTLNAKGSIKGSTDAPSVTFSPAQVQAFGGFASLNGTITEPATPAAKYDMTANIDMPSLMTVLQAFYQPAQAIQGPVKFQNVKLVGDGKKVLIQNLVGMLGTIGINGSGSVSFDGPRPKIDLNINTNGDIPLDAFMPAEAQKRGDILPYWQLLFPDLMPAATQVAQAQARPLNARWSRQPMGLLKTIRAYDANIGFQGQALVQGPYRIEKPQAHASIANGTLTVDRMQGTLFGGSVSITSKVNAVAQPPVAGIQAQVRNVNIAQGAAAARAHRSGRKWFLAFGRVELVEGLFDADMAYQAQGNSEAEMVQTLNGQGSQNARNGVIDGFDMKRLSDSMKNIDNALNLVQILGATTQGGQTRFQSITSTNRAQNGLLTSTNLLIKADAMEGKGGYNLDFPSYTMNTQITVTLTDHAKTPPIQVSAVGPIDQPQTVVNADALKQHLLASATRFILGGPKQGQPGQPASQGGVQDILKGVLGGQQQPAAPPPAGQPAPAPAPAPAQKLDPGQLLQQLLKPKQ